MLEYNISGTSVAHTKAEFEVRNHQYKFGITPEDDSASPADLLVGAFAACAIKNVERFSKMMKFEYEEAKVEVNAKRQDKPPMIKEINFVLSIKSDDPKLNLPLLQKNIEKFGTIYNTLNQVCEIRGEYKVV
jgi:uncharacterized OsmC-like protein